MIAIDARNITKIYRMYDKPIDRLKESFSSKKKFHVDVYALKDISFQVQKGETVGIIGKNGSGKSTLLKIITGVLTSTSGELYVNGKISAILELGTGFNPEYTGVENIFLNGTIMGLSRHEISLKLQEIVDFADIGEYIHHPVKTYSSGMFSRLAFAVAINVNPDILIIDEALAVGDMKFQSKCFNKLNDLKARGVTILFVGHDISSIRKFCDKTIWIDDGVLMRYGDTLEVTSAYMEYMYNDTDESDHENQFIDKVYEDDRQPINRWGSNVGLIKSVQIFDQTDKKVSVISRGQRIKIIVEFSIPKGLDLSTLDCAISIKNSLGLDLIISSTHDSSDIKFIRNDCNTVVTFDFVNYLNDGDYIVVAALEDRNHGTVKYYDYIEGAQYFRVFSKQHLLGLFNVPVVHNVEYVE